jgi:broad-specificity NMP kinase
VVVVWVTGNSGVGKSTVCEILRARGELAVDADWDGYNRWVDRETGETVAESDDHRDGGWLDRYAWRIDREAVEVLARGATDQTVFLCGSVENESEVRDLFAAIVCLVIDDVTLLERLRSRTTNDFGKLPEELAAARYWNDRMEPAYRHLGATVIDATRPPDEVADAVMAAARDLSR